jgi:hypothetical protein
MECWSKGVLLQNQYSNSPQAQPLPYPRNHQLHPHRHQYQPPDPGQQGFLLGFLLILPMVK